jgi:superfamily II DNA or RNA helicase
VKQSLFEFDFNEEEIEREIQVRATERKVTPRPYQNEAVDCIMNRLFVHDDDSTLAVMATGLGKSVVFSEAMRRYSEMVA